MAADPRESEYRVLSGKGNRSIVCHSGSDESGLLENCLLFFRGSKSNRSSDHHAEIDWSVFRDFFESKVFLAMKLIRKKNVLVLDRDT